MKKVKEVCLPYVESLYLFKRFAVCILTWPAAGANKYKKKYVLSSINIISKTLSLNNIIAEGLACTSF